MAKRERSFAEILQAKIDKHNRKVEEQRALMAEMVAAARPDPNGHTFKAGNVGGHVQVRCLTCDARVRTEKGDAPCTGTPMA